MSRIYADRLSLVNRLPNLRDLAPGVFRPLIPLTWRRDLASMFTTVTVNSQLRHDYPTVLEAADPSWLFKTGASTTYLPSISVPFLSGWWERFSSGSAR